MNVNKAFVCGRLTADPDDRVLPSGQPVVNFSVATNRFWTDKSGEKQEATEFHDIVVFGRLAEIASRYLAKGRLVLVEGRIQTRSWEDANGTQRRRTEIVAENIQLGPRSAGDTRKDDGGQPQQSSGQNNSANAGNNEDKEDIPVIDQEENTNEDDDIPF